MPAPLSWLSPPVTEDDELLTVWHEVDQTAVQTSDGERVFTHPPIPKNDCGRRVPRACGFKNGPSEHPGTSL